MESPCEQQDDVEISVTFRELQCLECEDVATCVSKETALKISQRSLANGVAKIAEVLSLWLTKLLKAYINEATCCLDVIKCLYEWFLQLKANVNPENEIACNEFASLLTDAVTFAEWARHQLLQASEKMVHTTVFFLFGIVYSCLQQSTEHNVETLKQHEPVAIELHLNVLQLLRTATKASKKVHSRITPLLRQLIEITDILSNKVAYLHAFLKTSQTMTTICTHYLTLCPANSQDDAKNMPDWLQETILHLCDTVLNHLETIYEEESLLVPRDKLEEYLKITQAYLIMLHKLLSCVVNNIDKSVLDTLMSLLNSGETKPAHDLGEHIPMLLMSYVYPYKMHVYELIISREEFQKHLIDYLTVSTEEDYDYYELCMDFVTVTVMTNTEISELTCQTLQNIIEYLLKDACHFTHAARYARILETFGSLLYVTHNATLMNYFCAALLEEDVVKSQVCADVLMLCFRLKETREGWTNQELMRATNYWNKCNNLYAIHSNNKSQWHVQRMLKYFVNLGKNELPLFNINNYRYLHAVSKTTEQQQRLCVLRLQRILNSPLNDIQQYYEIVALMELLSTGRVEWLQQLVGNLKELLLGDKCQVLARIYYKLALKSNRGTKLRILQAIIPAKSQDCWQLQRFLHACKCSDEVQFKSLTQLHRIDTDLLPILNAVQSVPTNAHKAENVPKNYYKLEYKHNRTHQCNVVSLKRKRIDIEPKEIIQQLQQQTQELVNCAAEMTPADVAQLSSIIENLKRISSL